MKRFALALSAALSAVALAAPARAALFSWKVDYTGWWENDGGGSVSGMFVADETAADDGIVSIEEMTSWMWDWSGNELVSAFSISSKEAGAATGFSPSFYVDGQQNTPISVDFVDRDNLDQGSFIGGNGNLLLDLQALLVASYDERGVEFLSAGNSASTLGQISVSAPTAVPEPSIGLLALLGVGVAGLKSRKQNG